MRINPQSKAGVIGWTLVWPAVALAAWLPMLWDALRALIGGREISFDFDFRG